MSSKNHVILSLPADSLIIVGREMTDKSVILFVRNCEGIKSSYTFNKPNIPLIATTTILPIMTSTEFISQPDSWDEMWDKELISKNRKK